MGNGLYTVGSIDSSLNYFSKFKRVEWLVAEFLAIDPSFRKTGICETSGSGFLFSRLTTPDVLDKSFLGILRSSEQMARRVLDHYRAGDYKRVVLEYPPPVSQFSGGMYLLCGSIVNLLSEYTDVELSPPAVSRTLFKVRKWAKSLSVQKAKPYFDQKGRLSSDEADAFMMLLPFMSVKFQQNLGVVRAVTYQVLERRQWLRRENLVRPQKKVQKVFQKQWEL